MRILKVVLVCACFVGLTQPLRSQKGDAVAVSGIPGHLDPQTGVFKPLLQQSVDNPEILALTPTTGKFTFTLTINIASTIAATAKINCTATAQTIDTGHLIFEAATVVVTRGTGSTATCAVPIPYSWPLATPLADVVGLSYNISVFATATSPPSRVSTQTFANIPVPATGSTTPEAVSATI